MAQVTIRINGFAYMIGCKDGEEEHLLSMASEVDQRIENIKSTAGPSGEARILVMAALLLADDLFEKDKLLLAVRKGGLAALPPGALEAATDPKLGRKLGRLAQRAEEIAAGLEHP